MGNGEAEGTNTCESKEVRDTASPPQTTGTSAGALLSCVDPGSSDRGLDLDTDQTASIGIPNSRKRSHCAVVSDFVSKLFSAISGDHFKNQIRWSEAGDSFIVMDQFAFAREVMPRLFSHTNYQSFVRQLNKYGFHKLKTGDPKIGSMGAMTAEFQHASFLRGHPEFLGEITRKKNVVRKLEPDAACGSGQVMTSAPPPLVVDTRMQRISPTPSTTWEGARLASSSSNMPDSAASFVDVMEIRFNQLVEMQARANINYSRAAQECAAFQMELNHLKNAVVQQDLLMEHLTNIVSGTMKRETKVQVLKQFQSALSREKFVGSSDSFAALPLLAPNKSATLHAQPSSSHLPTPFISDAPNSFDFSHPHIAPKPSSSFVRSSHFLPSSFQNASAPFDTMDFMTTAHHPTSRRAPPTQHTRQHHYNYEAPISFNMNLQQTAPLPIRANEKVLSQIAVNANLERSSSISSLHGPHHVKQTYRAFIISDDIPTRNALFLELNALNMSCEIIANQQSLRGVCSHQPAVYNQSCIMFLDHDSCMFDVPAAAKVIREMNPTVNLMLLSARPDNIDFRLYRSVGLSECLGKPVTSLGLRHVFEKAQIWL
ncbi:hypothetical protein BJ741DRAFT_667844 [Chytriomyces cf. hyalinus JEL632]|nr:hypothetical protein BJ741DRAFT_667844 [Chytriomyces cf. hyalinus JEL632]